MYSLFFSFLFFLSQSYQSSKSLITFWFFKILIWNFPSTVRSSNRSNKSCGTCCVKEVFHCLSASGKKCFRSKIIIFMQKVMVAESGNPTRIQEIQGVQENLCFFHNSMQPLPRLHRLTVTPIG